MTAPTILPPAAAAPLPPTASGGAGRTPPQPRPPRGHRTLAMLRDARPLATLAAALATVTATLVLLPLFEDASWVPGTWAVVGVVALTGLLCRGARLPVVLHPIVSAGALLTTLTIGFARPGAFLAILPGPQAMSDLRALAQDGLADAAVYVAPAPTTTALTLLVVGGVGLVALVVDIIGVTLRQPALAGLPLLAMYAVPAVVLRGGVPWWLFPPAAVGWLALLGVDSRDQIAEWTGAGTGARVTARRSGGGSAMPPRASALRAQGWRLAALALLAAVTLPAIVPGMTEPIWGTGRGGDPDGAGGVAADDGPVRVDPFVSLRRDLVEPNDREVIRYYTDDPDPSYLRLAALDRFDGVVWTPSPVMDPRPLIEEIPLPDVTTVADVRAAAYNITVGPLDNAELPLPFPALSLTAAGESGSLLDGSWTWDPRTRTASNPEGSAQGLQYQVRSIDLRPSAEELRAAGTGYPLELQALTEVPADLPPSVARLAREATAGARGPYDTALALQNWFAAEGGFTYSTSVRSGSDANYLEEFLDERVGYCEQFAATMALMARTLDIPARVAIGFTAGERQADGTWQVTVRDAHAWPELWIRGIGWIYFEPTPRAEPGSGVVAPPYADTPEQPDTPAAERGGANDPRRTGMRANEAAEIARYLASLQGQQDLPDEDAWRRGLLLVLLVLGAVVLAVPAGVRRWRRWRRLRGLGRVSARGPDTRGGGSASAGAWAEGAWAELRDVVRDASLDWSDADTPRQAAARLTRSARLSGTAETALRTLSGVVERSRYADPGTESLEQRRSEAARVRESLAVVHRALRRRLAWPTRVRSAVFPPSVMQRQGRGVTGEAVAVAVPAR